MEKKFDGNYTSILRTILNRSWIQHSMKLQLTAINHASRKLSILDKPDMWDIAGEVTINS